MLKHMQTQATPSLNFNPQQVSQLFQWMGRFAGVCAEFIAITEGNYSGVTKGTTRNISTRSNVRRGRPARANGHKAGAQVINLSPTEQRLNTYASQLGKPFGLVDLRESGIPYSTITKTAKKLVGAGVWESPARAVYAVGGQHAQQAQAH